MSDWLSPVDAAWFQMDEPGNASDIGVLLGVDGELSIDTFKALAEARLKAHPRFLQRVTLGALGRPRWAPNAGHRLSDQIHLQRVDDAERPGAIEDVVGRLMSLPFDLDRPLWDAWLLEGQPGRTTLFARVHHCIGDGFGLARLLLGLADPVPGTEPPPASQKPALPDVLGADFKRLVVDELMHPSRAADHLGRVASSLGHLMLMPFDRQSLLKGALTGVRRVAWSRPLPLDEVKAMGAVRGGTVNDVLLTAATGALRQYLGERGDDVDVGPVRAIVPVNLRPARSIEEVKPGALGNRFGLVFLPLPIHHEDAQSQMADLKAEMDRLKHSPEALVAFGLLGAIGASPAQVEHLVADVFGKKGSLVATNVPGPRQPLQIEGHRITDMLAWVPHPARLGLGLSIMSYAGQVRIGVRSDAAIVPDPERLARNFDAAVEAMRQADV